MAGITISDFSAFGSGSIIWYEDGVLQPSDGSLHFVKENSDYIYFDAVEYDESFYIQRYQIDGVHRTITFTAPVLNVINGDISNVLVLTFNGNTTINANEVNNWSRDDYKGTIACNGNLTLNATYNTSQGISELNISNGYLNVDNTTWINGNQDIVFGSNAQLQITSSSNGKTLIKANEVSGTITLDVQSGVQDGDTFLIEATDNQLVITDGEWTATPSTVGNVTTYTLAKAGPSKKQRLFYTYENGSKKLRFLTDSDGKQRLLGSL